MSAQPHIDRAFARLEEGLIHYRHSGLDQTPGLPVFMAHAGPGSSRGMEPLMQHLAGARPLVAWDMPGNGDSAAPLNPPTDIPYYTDAVVRLLDTLEIDTFDFYGSHTGAFIGMDFAVTHPDRVNRLILDGVMLLSDEERPVMLERYAPEITPDTHGGYLSWAHNFIRDMMLFYPYFMRDAEHRMPNDVPPPEMMHAGVVDVLKAIGTYHHAYRAAFAYEAAPVLPRIGCPVLLTSTMRDPLYKDLDEAARLLPAAQKILLPHDSTFAQRAQMILSFLDAET